MWLFWRKNIERGGEKLYLSGRIVSLELSKTMELNSRAMELQSKGEKVIRLTAGEPDIRTPDSIIEAAYLAMKSGKTKYTDNRGILELRRKISQYVNNRYLANYNENNVIVTNGGKQAIFNALFSIINPGDEIIIFDPSWVSYDSQIRMLEGIPIHIKCYEENNFLPLREDIEKAITNKTKAIIINSPNNPTGIVYPKSLLEFIVSLSITHNLLIISDEVYDCLLYDHSYTSMTSFDAIKEQLIVVNSFSKAWSMTGWRVGYALAPEEIISQMAKIQSHSTSNVNTPSQYAALKALSVDNSFMVEEFKKRRDYLFEEFKKLNLKFFKPQGAFYYFINISEFGLNDIEFCEKLLEYGLAVVPGSAFYADGFIRLSFAASFNELVEATKILKTFFRDRRHVFNEN
jgi:aspartate aminotransferase